MKFFTLLWISLFIACAAFAQDSIPNANFENWTFNPAPAYYTPNDWFCLNAASSAVNIYTCYIDSASSYQSKYSVKLVTKDIESNLAPGLLTLGVVNLTSGNVSGGIPIHSRPLALNGWYQYAPVGKDSASMAITLSTWNAAGDSEDVIGSGIFYAGTTVSSWTQFTVNVTYTSAAVPDTVNITFFSSASDTFQVGSTLLLDDLSYSYTAGINETTISPINIYPNPANGQLNIDNQTMLASSLNLYAADGQLVEYIKMHEGNNIVDVSSLPAGIYLLNGLGANGSLYSGKVAIDK